MRRALMSLCLCCVPLWAAVALPIEEGSTARVTLGPFTVEDGVTPIVPETVVYRIDVKGALLTDTPLLAMTTVVPVAATLDIVVPKAVNIVVTSSLGHGSTEDHLFTYWWTWAGGTKRGVKQEVFAVRRIPWGP